MDSAQSQSTRQVRAAGVAVAVMVVAEVTHRFAQQAMERFLSSRLSHIQATSTRTHAVRSVVQAFISISLQMAAECSLMISVRRGQSIHALIIPSFGITFHLLKVVHVFWFLRRANPKNQIQSQPNARKLHRLNQNSQMSYRLALLRGRMLAGCPSWLRGLSLDKLGLKRKANCSYRPETNLFCSASFSPLQRQDFTGHRGSFAPAFPWFKIRVQSFQP